MSRRNTQQRQRALVHDIGIVALSVIIAVILVETHALHNLLLSTAEFKFFGSFLAGLFFTSVFTTAPAIVALGEMAQTHSLMATAFFGSIGAVLGDLVIFRFLEDDLEEHLAMLIREKGMFRRTRKLFKTPVFRWMTFLVGGLLLASPLPDELAISILGAEKMKPSRFIALSFVFNFIGITLIGLVARAI